MLYALMDCSIENKITCMPKSETFVNILEKE